MNDSNPGYSLFQAGRDAFDRADYEHALNLFQQSLASAIHFKTLEMIGDCLCHLGRFREAIIPLAAASGQRPKSRITTDVLTGRSTGSNAGLAKGKRCCRRGITAN